MLVWWVVCYFFDLLVVLCNKVCWICYGWFAYCDFGVYLICVTCLWCTCVSLFIILLIALVDVCVCLVGVLRFS